MIYVRGFEAVNRNCVVSAVDIEGEVFVSAFNDKVRAIVGRLQWFPNRIMAYKHMCGSRQSVRNRRVWQLQTR